MTKDDSDQIKELLSAHCIKSDAGCWIWTRSYRGKGYAQLTLSGRRQVQGNRAAYIAYKGDIPAGMFVCHTCDNPACCNPDHLFLGTPQENTLDCVKKGRLRPGRTGGVKKLSKDDLASVVSMRSNGLLQREIASKLGVSQVRVSQILKANNVNN